MDLLLNSIAAFIVAFVVTYVMVPVSKRIAQRIGAIDYPSNRRVNRVPIPRCGGIALYCGFMAGLAVAAFISKHYGFGFLDMIVERTVNWPLLVVGITLMFGVGLFDDVRQMGAKSKFLWQIVACAIVFLSGISINVVVNPFGGDLIELGLFDGPITVFYLLVFVNVTNLIDGLDGLAAGLVAIVTTCLLVLVVGNGTITITAMCMALIAACLAFLRYNFHPASVFMGDSGSLVLGLVVGIISIMGVVRTASMVVMLVPLVIAGIPIIDTSSAVIRRTREHKKIDEPDMGHIHHRLLGLGFSQRKAVLILYGCSAVLGICGIAVGLIDNVMTRIVIFVVMAAVVAFAIWKLGLFKPVLQHYYVNRNRTGKRVPQGYEPGSQIPKHDSDNTDDDASEA